MTEPNNILTINLGGEESPHTPNSALTNAVMSKNLELVNALIADGADLDHANGEALNCAAYYGQIEIVKALLNAGANPNLISKNDDTPLICAAMKGHTEIAAITHSWRRC